jgi:hypothetical protein
MKIIHNAYPAKHEVVVKPVLTERLAKYRFMYALALRKPRAEFPLNDLKQRVFSIAVSLAATGFGEPAGADTKVTLANPLHTALLRTGSALSILAEYIEQGQLSDARKLASELMKEGFLDSPQWKALRDSAIEPPAEMSSHELLDLAMMAGGTGGAPNTQRIVATTGLIVLKITKPDGQDDYAKIALKARLLEYAFTLLASPPVKLAPVDEKGMNLIRVQNLRSAASTLIGVAMSAVMDQFDAVSSWVQHPWFLSSIRIDAELADELARALNQHAARGLPSISRPAWYESNASNGTLDTTLTQALSALKPKAPLTELTPAIIAVPEPLYVDITPVSRVTSGLARSWTTMLWKLSSELGRLQVRRDATVSANADPVPFTTVDAGLSRSTQLFQGLQPAYKDQIPTVTDQDQYVTWVGPTKRLAQLDVNPWEQHTTASLADAVGRDIMMPVEIYSSAPTSVPPTLAVAAPVTQFAEHLTGGAPRSTATLASMWNISVTELTKMMLGCLKDIGGMQVRGIAEALRFVGVLVVLNPKNQIVQAIRPLSGFVYNVFPDDWNFVGNDFKAITTLALTEMQYVQYNGEEKQLQLALLAFDKIPQTANFSRCVDDLAIVLSAEEANLLPLVTQKAPDDKIDLEAGALPDVLGWRKADPSLTLVMLAHAKPFNEDMQLIIGSNDDRGPAWIRRRNAIVTISDDDALDMMMGSGRVPVPFMVP